MTFLRIILSLGLVALGAIWTAREHVSQPYYKAEVSLLPQTPKSIEGWERRSALKSAWTSYADKSPWEVERTRDGYRMMLSEEAQGELQSWVDEWNNSELARTRLQEQELQKSLRTKLRQVQRLEQRKSALLKLEHDLVELSTQAPEWAKGAKDLGLGDLYRPSTIDGLNNETDLIEESVASEAPTPEENTIPTSTEDEFEARFRMRLSSEMNRAQSFISQGQKDLEDRVMKGQSTVVNRIVERLAGQEQRLLTILEQQLTSLESQDRHWEESLSLITLVLKDQLANLDLEMATLKDGAERAPAKAMLELTVKGVEAPPEALRDSFRFFLLGMVLCFVFNLVWEMVVQRDRL